MQEIYKQIWIILLNYNGFEDTVACMKSLMKINYTNLTILVIDNASPDGSGDKLEAFVQQLDEPYIHFLQSTDNLGFAGGNNLGIMAAIDSGAEYIWLLNNDTEVHPDSLLKLVSVMQKDPTVGMVGSKIYYYAQPSILWYGGGKVNRFGIAKHIGIDEEDTGQHDQLKETGYVTGCSLLARTAMIKEIGALEEGFFMYYEDVEWSLRAKRRGWKLYYAPDSMVWHKVGSSTNSRKKDPSPLLDYYDIRNQLLFIKKSYTGLAKVVPFIVLLTYRVAKKPVRMLVRRESNKRQKLRNVFVGLYHGITGKEGAL